MPHIILRRHLAAAIHTAASKDTRFYLCGVHVDGRVVVSTTGTIAAAFLGPKCDSYLPPFTIPLETAKRICRRKTEKLEVKDAGNGWIMIGEEMVHPIDGGYPDFRRVFLPATDPAPGGVTVDPELLAKFTDVGRALGLPKSITPRLYGTGEGASQAIRVALPNVESEFMGMIMPMTWASKDLYPVCGEWLGR